MNVDELLRNLLFRKFGKREISFDFLEGLLAVCITGTGLLIRLSFETALLNWPCLIVEWYLAFASAVLVWRYTGSRKKALGTYAVLLILPTIVAEGAILGGNACVGALFFVCALLFLGQSPDKGNAWLFTVTMAVLLLWSVRYIGIVFACMLLWKNGRLRAEQLLLLLAAGGVRFVYAYRVWLPAKYTLVTFHWPNIYEFVGKEAVQGQLIDPIAMVGLFLTPGLMLLSVWLFGQNTAGLSKNAAFERWEMTAKDSAVLLRLFLFFGLAAGYLLPYMDQSCGYLYCVLAVLYFMVEPGEFLVPLLLQIVAYAGYQECFNKVSMMSMTIFSMIQLLVIGWLGIRLLDDTGVLKRCRKTS